MVMPNLSLQVINKLHQALQQRFQLAIQQALAIGEFLSECMVGYQVDGRETEEIVRSRGRPRHISLLDKLDGIEHLGTSASCLQDQLTIFHTVSNFPLLMFANEPMNHLTCPEVRTATQQLQDNIHQQCDVPESVYLAYQRWTVYESLASADGQKPRLSNPIPYSTVSPNDGDGLIMLVDGNLEGPLESAVYTRLNAIDAPELSAIHFVKTDDLNHVFCKRMGHLSLCALHFILNQFVYSGKADLCEELPKDGMECQEDLYGRPIKEFWLRFTTRPTEKEIRFISTLEALLPAETDARKRLMSPYAVSQASPDRPFLLSVNALMVVTGFCHVFTRYCPDKLLLQLQAVARDNQLGPIWCGATRKFTFACKCENKDDIILEHFNLHSTSNLQNTSYPIGSQQEGERITLLPWHERSMIKSLCSTQTTRGQANDNLTRHLPGKEPQFGMYIDIRRYMYVEYVHIMTYNDFKSV